MNFWIKDQPTSSQHSNLNESVIHDTTITKLKHKKNETEKAVNFTILNNLLIIQVITCGRAFRVKTTETQNFTPLDSNINLMHFLSKTQSNRSFATNKSKNNVLKELAQYHKVPTKAITGTSNDTHTDLSGCCCSLLPWCSFGTCWNKPITKT
jgi:hypothetical protein